VKLTAEEFQMLQERRKEMKQQEKNVSSSTLSSLIKNRKYS